MTSVDTRKRELRALEAAMEDLGLERATVVTLSADERVSLPTGTVRIVPFWMWALDLVPSSEERDVR